MHMIASKSRLGRHVSGLTSKGASMQTEEDKAIPETLKQMMSSVTDGEKQNQPLWGMGVVAVTILVHFLHSLAQKELSVMLLSLYSDASPAAVTMAMACLQVLVAISVFWASGLNLTSSSMNREAAIVGVVAYFTGQFVHNYLLWSGDTAASACYSVQEPVLCMLLLYVAACIPTDAQRAGAAVCFCLGAALLTARLSPVGDMFSLLHVLASVFFLVRNMVIKHIYDSSVTFVLRSQQTLCTVAVCGAVAILLVVMLVTKALFMVSLMAALACVLSATLLYLLFLLLSLYDTLTVAVFMLWAQVLENTIFVEDVARPGLVSILLGAVLFAAGHYVYFKEGMESGTVHLNIKQVGVNELFTRLQFVLYASCIVGLVACLLKPYISERDISLLSYVGLDRIARKLLNVRKEQ